jgi:hypothetical protein
MVYPRVLMVDRRAVRLVFTLAIIAVLSAPPRAQARPLTPSEPNILCIGDCDGSGDVIVNELILMVEIALGDAPISACPAGKCGTSPDITVDCIVAAVRATLSGCSAPIPTETSIGPPTPTAILTRTPAEPTPTPSLTSCVDSLVGGPGFVQECCPVCAPTDVCIPAEGGSDCIEVVAPDSCCWSVTRNDVFDLPSITSGQQGCGNGRVCYQLDALICHECAPEWAIQVQAHTFTIGQRWPAPPPTPTLPND